MEGFSSRKIPMITGTSVGFFRTLKWRYVSTIFLTIFSGDIPWNLALKTWRPSEKLPENTESGGTCKIFATLPETHGPFIGNVETPRSQNVFLSQEGHVRLGDFGLCRSSGRWMGIKGESCRHHPKIRIRRIRILYTYIYIYNININIYNIHIYIYTY